MPTDNTIKFCPYCGSKTVPNAKFCFECGFELKIPEKKTEKDKKQSKSFRVLNEIREDKKENQKVSKSFSSLNMNRKESSNNFEIIRPNSENHLQTQQKPVEINKPRAPQQVPESSLGNINPNGLPCPSCGNRMRVTETSQLLSKSTYQYCSNCHLKFRQNRDFLILEDEPPFTRMSSRLHLKKYTLEQWKEILDGEHTPDFLRQFSKWQFDSKTQISCPACNHTLNRYSSSGLGSKHYLICPGCGLTLEEHKNNQYSLYESIENSSPLWKYERKLLGISDIKRIIDTEESEENRLFRERKVRENEAKIRKQQMLIRQREDDLRFFAESIESGKPMLPVPSDTAIVLKKDEVPVYKMYNISLYEPRAVRTTSGGYGGTSVRIAKGVTLHSGKTASTSESHDEIKPIDQGELLITNRRIIFLGSNRTTNIDMNKIISISSDSDTIQIQRSNKQKPEYFKNINATETFRVEGREYRININGEILKNIIMGLIST